MQKCVVHCERGRVSARAGPDFRTQRPVYFSWLEEACNGTLGIAVVNLRTMHDSGQIREIVLENAYVREAEVWKIRRVTYRE